MFMLNKNFGLLHKILYSVFQ